MMNSNKGLIPVADRINSWGTEDKRKILFKCANCHTSFGYYEESEKFCHNCGQKVNWEDVKVNQIIDRNLIRQCMNNLQKHNETIEKINQINSEVKDDSYGG